MSTHLHFVQSLEPLQGGGLGRAALELHQQILALNGRSRLISTRDSKFREDWPQASQFVRWGPSPIFFAPDLLMHGRKAVEEADVVHGHGFYVMPNMVLGGEARRRRKPLVYHPHGMFEPWILQRSPRKKEWAHYFFEDANFRHARLWRALTHKEADQIRERGINAPIVVAPNGIHLAPFGDGRMKRPTGDRRRILFLGRLHPKKGFDLLLPAWKKLGAFRKKWELIIAGPDEKGYAAIIRQMVRDLELADEVTFHGLVQGKEKVDLLQSADLFVLPSHSEGFSVALLEAMACCVPVIATQACNFPEVQRLGGGWECDTTIDSLARALNEALTTSDFERGERGQAARALVEQRYTWPVITQKILDACQCYCRN